MNEQEFFVNLQKRALELGMEHFKQFVEGKANIDEDTKVLAKALLTASAVVSAQVIQEYHINKNKIE